ncbi:hypothetical protein Q1695_006600 [Nippostrongylus brasiliensis]|nr:hypothetical protein Q1695_006600 [Nippostrongylus brasiliensis]
MPFRIDEIVYTVWLTAALTSSIVFTLLTCDTKAERFEDDDPDSPANKAKREAQEKKKKEMEAEQKQMQEGLKKGEFRPVDPNETINEVASNWGAAMAMARAKGDEKYFERPAQAQGSDTPLADSDGSKESKESKEKPKQKFRPANDNETVNEVVSNWGAAQAMLQKREGVANVPAKPPPAPALLRPQGKSTPLKGFRPANDNETVNEVVSNWGAAQAMLQKKEGVANVPAKPPPAPALARPQAKATPMKGFRPANDNETVNEVVSNWGAAQAMLQKKEGAANVPAKPAVPPPPRPQAKAPLKGFRPANDNETVNEVVSNWGAAQGMLMKNPIPQKPPPPKPAPKPPPGMGKVRKANDFETIDECVSNWGAVQALAKKKGA